MKRDEIIRILQAQREELMGRFGILSLSLFGSVAREEAEVTSDVDVLPDHSQGNADAAGVSPSPGSLKRGNCDKARPDPGL